MTADPILVLSWLVLAHLAADFVLQTEHMATAKFGDGREAWRALASHVAVVGLLVAPAFLVFGLPGLVFVALTVVAHIAIDRTKIVLTRRVEPRPASGAERTTEEVAAGPALDPRWTAVPGALFLLDQAAHLVVLLVGWAVLLANAAPLGVFTDIATTIRGTTDPATFHHLVTAGVVVVALLIVNVRAASLFIATLVRPPAARRPGTDASEARVGAVIGILERLLICALVVGGAVATIGLVIAAKTLARFKQLDDREFAEYYLLGTLASVTIAVSSSLLGQAILAR